jgi:hypothetical protein
VSHTGAWWANEYRKVDRALQNARDRVFGT